MHMTIPFSVAKMRYPTLFKHGHAASIGFRARGLCLLEAPNIELSRNNAYDPSCISPTSIMISDKSVPLPEANKRANP